MSALSVYGEDTKFAFSKTTADANTVTINRGSTDTIHGATSVTLTDQYELSVLIGDSATGTWTNSAATGGGGTTFADGAFQIYNTADATKIIDWDLSNITTGTTRTLTAPNSDWNMNNAAEFTQVQGRLGLDTDTNTYIKFAADKIELWAGSLNFFAATETSTDLAAINPAYGNIDFAVFADSARRLISSDATTEQVTIGGTLANSVNTLETDVGFNVIYTDSMLIPRGTTAEAPATGINGMMRYDSDTNKFMVYENGAWSAITGAAASWADYDGTADGAIDLTGVTKTTTSYGYRAVRLSDTKAILLYLDTANEFIYGHVMTYDSALKTITFGAKQTVVTGGTSAFNNNSSFISDTIEMIDATNFVFGYREYDNVSKNEAKVAICSISGDTITVDSTATYNTVSTDRISISKISSTALFVAIVANNTVKGNVATMATGTSISFNTWVDLEPSIAGGSSGSFSCKADSNGESALVLYNDTTTAAATRVLGVGLSGTTVSAGTVQQIELDKGSSITYGQTLIRNFGERQYGFLTNGMLSNADSRYRNTFVIQATTTAGATNAPTVVSKFIDTSNSTMNSYQLIEMADHDLYFTYTSVTGIEMNVMSKGARPVAQHNAQVLDMADVTGSKNLGFDNNSSCCFVKFDDDAVAMLWGDSTTEIGYKIIRKA